MSETSRKVLKERLGGRLDANTKAHSEVSLVRDRIKSVRGRIRFLFSMSGFVMVCGAMVLVPVAIGIASMVLGDADPENTRVFLSAALGLCIILLELGIIFKMYADAIDHEMWYYSIVGSQPPTETNARCRFLKLCTMGFIALGAALIVWGMFASPPFPPPEPATLLQGNERHMIDLSRQATSDKSNRLAILSLLMAILSLQYFNQVKRDELRGALSSSSE